MKLLQCQILLLVLVLLVALVGCAGNSAEANPTGALTVSAESTMPSASVTSQPSRDDSTSLTLASGAVHDESVPQGWEYALIDLVTCPLSEAQVAPSTVSSSDDVSAALIYDLQGLDFRDANLQGANFGYADLRGADFTNADLVTAQFYGADLRNAVFAGVRFSKETDYGVSGAASLAGANLAGQDLSGVDLRQVNLTRANLSGTDLRGTRFLGDYLEEADLKYAIFEGATLDSSTQIDRKFRLVAELQTTGRIAEARGEELSSSDLRGVDMTQADMREADLSGADLRGVEMIDADLRATNLSSADLRGADLTGAKLENADLRYATVDEHTKLDAKWLAVWQAVNSKLSERLSGGAAESSQPDEEDLVDDISLAALLGTDCLNDGVGFFRRTDQITELNRLGEQGWDVVSIRRLYSEYLYEGIEVYLKRPQSP